jgi:iron(III) transport system permease protein
MGVTFVLLLVIGVPLALPILELAGQSEGWRPWQESQRLLLLASNTIRLVAGTVALAIPAGTFGAFLFYRTNLPLRRVLRFVTVVILFVPLPLLASAWQAALGPGGLVPLGAWSVPSAGDPDVSPTGMLWKPWAQGLWAAIWVHAMAALPWVILLVGLGLCWVERELEEEALTVAGPWRVLWNVTLPRCWAAMLAATLWVTLQTASEITVTDPMQVRTFAEEVYTEIVGGGQAAIARSVAVALPSVFLTCGLAWWAVQRLQRRLAPLWTLSRSPLVFSLGWARWPCLAAVLLAAGLLAGVPLGSLIWKAGLEGMPAAWSAARAWRAMHTVWQLRRVLLLESFSLAAVAGVLAAAIGLLICWLCVGGRWFQIGVLCLLTAAWALPGPLVGFGLKETIQRLLDLLGSDPSHPDPLARALWYGPSPLPILWAYLLRFTPIALALLWPVARLIPAELYETARVEGARPAQQLWHVVGPLAFPACLHAALAVTILALGELSASKLVETPGSQTFAHEIFVQMHYGVANDLAARCLLLLAVVMLGGALVAGATWLLRKKTGAFQAS